jgi:hypothetical protein
VDRLLSALNVIPGVLWNSAALFSSMTVAGLDTDFANCISNDASLLGWKLYAKDMGSPPLIDIATGVATVGTGGAGQLPTQNCGLASFVSSIGGAAGKGRMYFPFPYTAAVAATGLLDAAYVTQIGAVTAKLVGGFTVANVGVGGGSLSIKACTHFTVGSAPPLAFPMTTVIIRDGFATQRRRGFFGKPNSNPF